MQEQLPDNVIPIEHGVEIRAKKILEQLRDIKKEYESLSERLQDINKKISEELQTERDEKTDGILQFLVGQHGVIVEMKKDFNRKLDELEKEDDLLTQQDNRFSKEH